MDFRILGPVEVVERGEPLRLGGPGQRALLAYLLLHEGEVVQAHRLLDELWHCPPTGGVAAVHTQVSRLRRVVGERIATVDNGYALHRQKGDELDLARFRSLLAEAGIAGDPESRAQLLRAADTLWRGTPFDGLDVPFMTGELLALEELRLAATEERLEAQLEAGHDADLVAELATLVSRHPLRERLRRQWILALYRSGRQADALAAYRETRRMFDEELGLELSPALAELERAILQHDPSLDRPRKPTRASVPATARRSRPLLAIALVLAGVAAIAGGAATAVVLTGSNPPQPLAVHEPRTVVETRRVRVPVKAVAHLVAHAAPKKPKPAIVLISSRETTVAAAPPPPPVTTTVVEITRTPVVSRPTTSTTIARQPPKPKPKPKPAPKLTTMSDSFNGTAVNERTWYSIGEGNGWSMDERGGHLEFSFRPGTTPDPHTGVYGGHVATQCRFPGDFDARVDYTLAQWPSASGMSVLLWSFLGPQPLQWSMTRRDTGRDEYSASTGASVSVPSNDMSGTLRVARHDGLVTMYFFQEGSWRAIARAESSAVASIAVGVLGGQAQGVPFNGQPVVVDLDNFRMTAVNPVC